MVQKSSVMGIVSLLILIFVISAGCVDTFDDEAIDTSFLTDTDHLIGYWQFEEEYQWNSSTDEVRDSSEYNQHGYANGTIHMSPGKIGSQYAFFDGVDDYILIPNNNTLEPKNITVEAWVKSSNPGTFGYILSKGGSDCIYSSYGLYTDVDGGLSFYITDSNDSKKSPNPGPAVWDDQWHHVAGTFDGSFVRLYVDGDEIGQGTQASTSIQYNLTDGNDLAIGSYIFDCMMPFNGSIDDVLLWDTALSSEVIYQHYLLGSDKTSEQRTPTIVSLANARNLLCTFLEPYTQNDILAIQGGTVTIQDKLLITLVRSQIKNVDDIKTIPDTNISQVDVGEYSVLVLLGSEKTNQYTAEILSYHDFSLSSYLYASPFMLMLGHDNSTDKDIVVIFTATEIYNLENKAAERSPLSGIIDKKYVPIVATATSIFALYLWNIFGNTVVEFLFDFTSEKVQEHEIKKRRKQKRRLIHEQSEQNVLLKEIAGIVLAVLVFSTAMSWTWSSHLSEFFTLFLVNICVIGAIFSIKEILRVHLSKKKKMRTEHVFWPFGAALTMGSTILGNTFSLASYTYYDNPEAIKQYGRMYFFIFLSLYIFSLATFILNFLFPSVIFQMMFVFSIMSVFIDMTPLDPMDGYDVKFWNFNAWLLFYILVACSYLIMNFTFFI